MTEHEYVRNGIMQVFQNRIALAPVELVQTIAETKYVVGKLYDISDYIVLGIFPPRSVEKHRRFFSRYGSPYPGLLKTNTRPAGLNFAARYGAVQGATILVDLKSSVLGLEVGTSAYMHEVGVKDNEGDNLISYVIDLAFVARIGPGFSHKGVPEAFEALMAAYINNSRRFAIEYVEA